MKKIMMDCIVLLFILVAVPVYAAPMKLYIAEITAIGVANRSESQASIKTLLASRLNRGTVSTVATEAEADAIVTGSYVVSGSMFSLDAVVTAKGKVIARTFEEGDAKVELILAVDRLAKKLSESIDKGSDAKEGAQAAIVVPDLVKPVSTLPATEQLIYRIPGAMSGLAFGRTLNGGERELFVVANHTLRYYRQGTELKLITEIPYKVNEKILAVDTADLDGNMIPEIYLTIMNGEILASQVWSVDGTSLKQIAGPLPYYFRAITLAGGSKKLFAQQISGKDDFLGPVAELVKSGEGYTLTNPVKLPKEGYLYNFNILKGVKGEANAVLVDRNGYLKVYNASGDELAKSREEFSGSETYFNRSDINSLESSGKGFRQVFLDQRIVTKPNGEFIVPKNSASWYMLNKHYYSKNSLYCFSWDGANLQEKWHTNESGYYLADFAYDESAKELLLLEVVSKVEGIFDKGASRIVVKKID
jgi:hypothetical protein